MTHSPRQLNSSNCVRRKTRSKLGVGAHLLAPTASADRGHPTAGEQQQENGRRFRNQTTFQSERVVDAIQRRSSKLAEPLSGIACASVLVASHNWSIAVLP